MSVAYQKHLRFSNRRLLRISPNVTRYEISRSRWISKVIQSFLSLFLLATIIINLSFLYDKSRSNSSQIVAQEESFTGLSRRNNFRLQESVSKSIAIEVVSSQTRVTVNVDGTTILDAPDDKNGRGIHVLVLHEGTGAVMSQRLFDTYSPHEDESLALFVNMVSSGRLIVMAIKDEGTYQLKQTAKVILQTLGSNKIEDLGWRDMWAFVVQKGVHVYGEESTKSPGFNSWGAPIIMRVEVPLVPVQDAQCNWTDTEESKRRHQFCNHIEGYGSVCSCKDPASIQFTTEPLLNNQINNVPVAILASNRPHYLYRCIRSLLSSPGINPEMVTVFIDGFYEEPLAVAKLFDLRGIQHTPIGLKNSRISQHYKSSIIATFNIFPSSKYVILLEEDLDVSPDFFSYFSQTLHLLEEDPSIYCISAWNDQGYDHTASDPALLYRVETMPGLGWILKKDMFQKELEPNWPTPDKLWDWDIWMRLNSVRKNRECIVPDISRTYHFGAIGLNMNSFFQDSYFKKRSFNAIPHVEFKNLDKMKLNAYEKLLEDNIRVAKAINHSDPCADDFSPQKGSGPLLYFIKMEKQDDFSSWLHFAKCMGIWDLDARGFHHGMWRLFLNSNPLFVIGYPYSPYSKWKPENISAAFFPPKEVPKEVLKKKVKKAKKS